MRFVLGLTLLPALMSCAAQRPQLAGKAVDWERQKTAILDVAPLGTHRDEVGRRLQDAGVDFSASGESGPWQAGMSSTLFYCDRWLRDDGDVWPLEVELLFDPAGQLYQVRQSQPAVALVEDLPSP